MITINQNIKWIKKEPLFFIRILLFFQQCLFSLILFKLPSAVYVHEAMCYNNHSTIGFQNKKTNPLCGVRFDELAFFFYEPQKKTIFFQTFQINRLSRITCAWSKTF